MTTTVAGGSGRGVLTHSATSWYFAAMFPVTLMLPPTLTFVAMLTSPLARDTVTASTPAPKLKTLKSALPPRLPTSQSAVPLVLISIAPLRLELGRVIPRITSVVPGGESGERGRRGVVRPIPKLPLVLLIETTS